MSQIKHNLYYGNELIGWIEDINYDDSHVYGICYPIDNTLHNQMRISPHDKLRSKNFIYIENDKTRPYILKEIYSDQFTDIMNSYNIELIEVDDVFK